MLADRKCYKNKKQFINYNSILIIYFQIIFGLLNFTLKKVFIENPLSIMFKYNNFLIS